MLTILGSLSNIIAHVIQTQSDNATTIIKGISQIATSIIKNTTF